jgi:hypothetical protein
VDRVEFRTRYEALAEGPTTTAVVVPYVNGEALPEMLRRIEAPSARRDGDVHLAGSYAGLPDDGIRWPSRHYLGEPVLSWFEDGDTVLLGCGCGEWGCWPFTAVVTVEHGTVTWSGYRNGHRDWDYGALRELVFARGQYEAAVRATAPP